MAGSNYIISFIRLILKIMRFCKIQVFSRLKVKCIDIAHVSKAYIYLSSCLYNKQEKDRDSASAPFALLTKDEFGSRKFGICCCLTFCII